MRSAWTGRARRRENRQLRGALKRALGYDGAKRGRRTDGWLTTSGSANTLLRRDLRLLRNRSRDLVRNDPHAAKAIATVSSNMVGDGIRPLSRAMVVGDPEADTAALDRTVDQLFAVWAETCTIDGQLDYFGCQTLAARSMLETGEVLLRRRPLGRDALVPVAFEILEADHLDMLEDRQILDGVLIQGVEFDTAGRRVAYLLLQDHPGDTSVGRGALLRPAVRVDAADVAHIYETLRPGQVRGVPWLWPIMLALRDLEDYRDAERVRKKIEACAVAFVFASEDESDGLGPRVVESQVTDNEDLEGETILEQIEPGMIAIVKGGKDVRFNQPASVGGYGEYIKTELRAIAAGARMTYELLSGDLSQVNFSSIRAGLIEFRRMIKALRTQVFIRLFCRRTWGWFIDAAIGAGLLSATDEQGRPIVYRAKWSPARFESVDRIKDAMADLIELRTGTASLTDILESRGRGLVETLVEIAEANALIDELKLVLDSDPRTVTKAGVPVDPLGLSRAVDLALAAVVQREMVAVRDET